MRELHRKELVKGHGDDDKGADHTEPEAREHVPQTVHGDERVQVEGREDPDGVSLIDDQDRVKHAQRRHVDAGRDVSVLRLDHHQEAQDVADDADEHDGGEVVRVDGDADLELPVSQRLPHERRRRRGRRR